MNKRYAPIYDRLLVSVDPEIRAEATTSEGGIDLMPGEKLTGGGIILTTHPTTQGQAAASDLREATVLAVGGGEVLYDGSYRDLPFFVGDRVLLHLNEVLPIVMSADPTDPIIGFINDRHVFSHILATAEPDVEAPAETSGEGTITLHGEKAL